MTKAFALVLPPVMPPAFSPDDEMLPPNTAQLTITELFSPAMPPTRFTPVSVPFHEVYAVERSVVAPGHAADPVAVRGEGSFDFEILDRTPN